MNFVKLMNKYVKNKRVWFPVCRSEKNKEGGELFWYVEGKGLFGSMKKDFIKLGGYDEKFTDWGLEDTDLWMRFYRAGFFPLRSKERMIHKWHVPVKDPLLQ